MPTVVRSPSTSSYDMTRDFSAVWAWEGDESLAFRLNKVDIAVREGRGRWTDTLTISMLWSRPSPNAATRGRTRTHTGGESSPGV